MVSRAPPMLALIVAVPSAWGWGLSWLDIVLFAITYTVSLLGRTVGYYRHFTHGSFKAKRWLRVSLAVLGSTAMQGPLLHWAADHRRHHAASDKEGDPHSPWLFGTSPVALARGFWHAHMGWLFNRDLSNPRRFVPHLLADKTMVPVSKLATPGFHQLLQRTYCQTHTRHATSIPYKESTIYSEMSDI